MAQTKTAQAYVVTRCTKGARIAAAHAEAFAEQAAKDVTKPASQPAAVEPAPGTVVHRGIVVTVEYDPRTQGYRALAGGRSYMAWGRVDRSAAETAKLLIEAAYLDPYSRDAALWLNDTAHWHAEQASQQATQLEGKPVDSGDEPTRYEVRLDHPAQADGRWERWSYQLRDGLGAGSGFPTREAAAQAARKALRQIEDALPRHVPAPRPDSIVVRTLIAPNSQEA